MKGHKNFVYNLAGITAFEGPKGTLQCDIPHVSKKYERPLDVVSPQPGFEHVGVDAQLRKELNAIGRWVVLWRTGQVARVLMQDGNAATVSLLGDKGVMKVPNREWLEFTPDLKRVARNTSLARVSNFYTKLANGAYDGMFTKLPRGKTKDLSMSLVLRFAPEKARLFGTDATHYLDSIACALKNEVVVATLAMAGDKRWMLGPTDALTKAKAAARAGTLFVNYDRRRVIDVIEEADGKALPFAEVLRISDAEKVAHQSRLLREMIGARTPKVPAIKRVQSVESFQDEAYRASPPISPRSRPASPVRLSSPVPKAVSFATTEVQSTSEPEVPPEQGVPIVVSPSPVRSLDIDNLPETLPPPAPMLPPDEFFRLMPSKPVAEPAANQVAEPEVEAKPKTPTEPAAPTEAEALRTALRARRAALEDEDDDEEDADDYYEEMFGETSVPAPGLAGAIRAAQEDVPIMGLKDMQAMLARAGVTQADVLTFAEAEELRRLMKEEPAKFAERREERAAATAKRIEEELARFRGLNENAQTLALVVAFGEQAVEKGDREVLELDYARRLVDPLLFRARAVPKVSREVDAVPVDIAEARRQLERRLAGK